MMLFRSEAEAMQVQAAYIPLPEGLVPRFVVRAPADEMTHISGPLASTAQKILTWQWTPPSGPAIAGELTWPYSYEAAEDHAVSLLTIAESGFLDGCAPRRPPAATLLRFAAVRRDEVSDDALTELAGDYSRAVRQWTDVPQCTRKPR